MSLKHTLLILRVVPSAWKTQGTAGTHSQLRAVSHPSQPTLGQAEDHQAQIPGEKRREALGGASSYNNCN